MSEELILSKISDALKKIKYGSVEIIVHGGKIIQIESREKIRFDQAK